MYFVYVLNSNFDGGSSLAQRPLLTSYGKRSVWDTSIKIDGRFLFYLNRVSTVTDGQQRLSRYLLMAAVVL